MKVASPRDNADFWAGVMFVAFGAVAVYMSRNYPMGTAMRMGPGYFPHYLGMLLIGVGAAVSIKGLLKPGDRIGSMGRETDPNAGARNHPIRPHDRALRIRSSA